MALKNALIDLVQGPLEEEGFELVEMKLAQFKRSNRIQMFVDSDNGVSIEDCVRLTRLLGPIIEESELFSYGYVIEVSSPGLERPLKTARDFKRRVGEKIRLFFVDDERPPIEGELVEANEEGIEILIDDDRNKFVLDNIRIGKVIF